MGKQYTIDELNNCSKETVIAIVLAMQDQLERLNQNVEYLIEQIGVMNNKQYSRSSEKLDVIDDQLSYLFNEAEALIENKYVVEPTEDEVIMVTRRKKAGKRDVDLKGLPVEEIIHKMSDEDLEKTFGPNGWKQLPDEIYKRVKVDPAVFTVQEHHVQVYAGKDNQTIVKADRPKSLLRNSIATPSLVASIMNGKYVNGMPLHRISQDYLRNDIHISKQVMANWMIQCADRYLGTLYDRLHEEMYQFHVLQADETPVKVSKDGRPANSQSYMWIYRTGKHYKDTPIILYEYQKTRKSDHPKEFLKNFKGVVVTDGYSAYKKLDKDNQDITFAGC
ncbi:IS66 family transposase, partial [Petrocella sp. FN5]|uniref:IS66 family transposase n=1 Tax=Petrocella sp. FN5 TaxID=3032002 RepID=UPI0023DCDC20